jgi:tetratricopeptide (TPR) repeat protein
MTGTLSTSAAGARLFAAAVLAFASGLGAAPAAHAAPDPFYLDLMRDGTQAYDRGDYTGAAKQLRLACFGMLDEPDRLAGCLTRLGLAQAAAGNADAFRETFRRIVEVESRFGAYAKADLPPEVRAAFEQRALAAVPAGTLDAIPAWKGLLARKLEAQIAALPPRERRRQLEERLAKEPRSIVWNLLQVDLDLAEGKTAPAIARAEATAALAPRDAQALCVRGLARAAGNRCVEAVADLEPCSMTSGAGGDLRYATALLGCRVELAQWRQAEEQVRGLPPAFTKDRKIAALMQQVAKHKPAAGPTGATGATGAAAAGGGKSGRPAPAGGTGSMPASAASAASAASPSSGGAGRPGAATSPPATAVQGAAKTPSALPAGTAGTATGGAGRPGAATSPPPGTATPATPVAGAGSPAPATGGAAGTAGSATTGATGAPRPAGAVRTTGAPAPGGTTGAAADPSSAAAIVAGGPPALPRPLSPLSTAEREAMARSERLLTATAIPDLREALRLARQLADAHPDSKEAQYLAGAAAYRNSRWPEAAAYFRRGGPPGDDHPELLFYMAVAFYEVGDQPGAASALKRSLPNLQKTPFVESYVKRILGQ